MTRREAPMTSRIDQNQLMSGYATTQELAGLRWPKVRHPIYYPVFQESSVAVGVASQLTTVAAPEEIGGGCGFAV